MSRRSRCISKLDNQLWLVGHRRGFTSTGQLKNRRVTGPIAVTPILFMADGSEYDLGGVNVPHPVSRR